MKGPRIVFGALAFLSASTLLVSCSQKETGEAQPIAEATPEQDESAIRALDAEWVKAVTSKNAQQSASFYAENGELMAPGAPIAVGRDAVQKTWAGLMGTSGFALTFTPSKIRVSSSGDLAYELGTYELTTNSKNGKAQTMKANYVVVWGKQADGTWKALVDAPTTTQ